jgi:LmbE family N-acetylglucosaminyl deacetylase
MQYLHKQGHKIHLGVVTSGTNGVADGWNGVQAEEEKAALREAEQRASCEFFGLPVDRLTFLRLWESTKQELDEQRDYEVFRAYLHDKRPNLVFLPHGNDSNHTHRRTYETFRRIAIEDALCLQACLNLDAKTVSMRRDLYAYFGEEDAVWKAQLLRFHRSQQERNLKSRGQGFDQRVLSVNRQSSVDAGGLLPYAEVFELQVFG